MKNYSYASVSIIIITDINYPLYPSDAFFKSLFPHSAKILDEDVCYEV